MIALRESVFLAGYTRISQCNREVRIRRDRSVYLGELRKHFPIILGGIAVSKPDATGIVYRGDVSLFFRKLSVAYIRSLICCARSGCAFIFLPVGILYAPALAWRFLMRRPVVVYIGNGFLREVNCYFKQRKWVKGVTWLLLHVFLIGRANLAFARGKFLTGIAEEIGAKSVMTKPLLVDVKRGELSEPRTSDGINIGFVGKDFPGKGLDVLFRALGILRQNQPQLRGVLHVCGCSAPFLDQCREGINIAPQWGIQRHGDMLGPEELIDTIRGFDVLIVPSTTYPEGVPRVIDEAIAAGVPVIASSLPSIRIEYPQGEVRLFDVGSPESLACQLESFHADLSPARFRPAMEGDHMRRAAEQHATYIKKFGINLRQTS